VQSEQKKSLPVGWLQRMQMLDSDMTASVTAVKSAEHADAALEGNVVRVRVSDSVRTDALNDSSIVAPQRRPIVHVMIRRMMDDTPPPLAAGGVVDVSQVFGVQGLHRSTFHGSVRCRGGCR
jgi:hypothetical protein